MTTYTVTNNHDHGAGSLRDAIAKANAHVGDDAIEFSLAPAARTIVLTSGQLVIDNAASDDGGRLTIHGDLNNDGRPDITIDARHDSRVLSVHGDGAGYAQRQN